MDKYYLLLLTLILITNTFIVFFLFKFSNDYDSIRTAVYKAETHAENIEKILKEEKR